MNGNITLVISMLIVISGCVQFKPATFYTGELRVPPVERPERIAQVVEPEIFMDDDRDVWGLEKDECKTVQLSTDVTYKGNSSIRLEWDRGANGCTWAGIGIGWDGYAGKNLNPIMDHAAISFYVRTIEGRSFGLPFVFTLEDYSGGMGFCYTANKYFERTSIDEEWQRVVVPLADFDLETEGLDVTNIKQLQIELQQSGQVYIDNIELVFFKPEPQKPWLVEPKLPDPVNLPVTLFDDSFINNNGWGIITDRCQEFRFSSDEAAVGSKSIYTNWNTSHEQCHLTRFGVSWNRWHPTDITEIRQNAAIQFQIKMIASNVGEDVSIAVGFEDYDRSTAALTVQNAYSATGTYSPQWTTVTLPLSQMPDDIDFTRVKHLFFDFQGTGECYIDDIRLINLAATAP